MKRVVVFGAGLVAPPLLRYLLDHGFDVTVAAADAERAAALVAGRDRARALALDVDRTAAVERLVAESDLAVSLLPAAKHPLVAQACIDRGRHLVTTSYVSPAMRALDAAARARGVLLLNEMGVDPGIDHMSAMQLIDRERAAGAELVGFRSWCGGLPAPEVDAGPFGYKFSWSPRAVLTAARNPARYLRAGRVVAVEPAELFARPELVEVGAAGTFEGYPNRDAVAYLDGYGFDRQRVRDFFRGTLRNRGHCRLFAQLVALGLIEPEPAHPCRGKSHRQLLAELLGGAPEQRIPQRLGVPAAQSPLAALEHIGLLSDAPIGRERISTLNWLAQRMSASLAYREGERDMLLMRHDLTFARPGGARRRTTAVMTVYGIPGGDSAMARTVSLPAAIAARLLLEGRIPGRGVRIPTDREIYAPVLAELAQLGIGFEETRAPA